jgi:glycosyltransferase involved in cell wall biosynthesis
MPDAPIKVGYVLLSDQAGGAERQMLALAERLPRERFSPELIVRSPGSPFAERATRAGIRVRTAEAQAGPPSGGPAGLAARAAKAMRLVRMVRSARYDVIDAWLYPADVAMALARPLTRGPLVISGRRNLDLHDRFGRLEGLVGAVARRQTDTVVANSAAAARHAVATQAVDPARLRIIRNGVEIPDPISPDERAALRRELGAKPEDIVVGCMASYSPAKRLDLLIDAFGLVARDEPNARLELVGGGPLRSRLEAQVSALGLDGRVCLHGFEPEPERLYPAFDLVALSSDREGLPNALLEAGAAGRGIVSTAAGGADEIVIDGQTGLLVATNDVLALAAALGRLVRDRQLRDRLGLGARQHVAATFGMDRFVAEFASLYEERVAARRRGPVRSAATGT